jgi:beta-galactosidase/beta-glucuronidase
MAEKKRIAVLVSGGGTNLQALIDAQQRGENPDGEIVLVIASNDKAYALQRAENAGIKHMVLSRKALGGAAAFDDALIKTLQEEKIVMPFPPQSKLSEYKGEVGTTLEYKTEFGVPKTFEKERIILHFGAVDQVAKVWVNGMEAGSHEGGYLPFSFDITDLLQEKNEIAVCVQDDLCKDFPYGKQTRKRGGMWYTPTSGIWQSVWLESVPKDYIRSIRITQTAEAATIEVDSDAENKILKLSQSSFTAR